MGLLLELYLAPSWSWFSSSWTVPIICNAKHIPCDYITNGIAHFLRLQMGTEQKPKIQSQYIDVFPK